MKSFRSRYFFVLALVPVVVYLVFLVRDTYPLLSHLRIPLAAGWLLVFFPFFATAGGAEAMLGNLFHLPNASRLAFVIAAAVVSGLSVVFVAYMNLQTGPARFDLAESAPNELLDAQWLYLCGVLLALPVIVMSLVGTVQEIPMRRVGLGVLMGLMLCAGVLLMAAVMTPILERIVTQLMPAHWLEGRRLPGILDTACEANSNANPNCFSYHVQAVGFFGSVFVVYLFCIWVYRPRIAPHYQAATLFYVLVLFTSITLVVGFFAYFFDRYHLPAVLVLVLFWVANFYLFRIDHVYRLIPEPAPVEATAATDRPAVSAAPDPPRDDLTPDLFARAVRRRLERAGATDPDGGRSLVVVCISGGGIQSAGWSTTVLTRLQRRPGLGPRFTRHIGLISSVSGGSVGTMFYLNRFLEEGYADPAQLDRIVEDATADSLDSTGWGLAFLDFPRSFVPYFYTQWRDKDRGWALEQDWKQQMQWDPRSPTTLSRMRAKVLDGTLPTPVFNATVVDDGRRYLISPLPFAETARTERKAIDFVSQYPGYDMEITTAARLSATFPYVSPICYNSACTPRLYVTDGGFFDNYGVFTSVEWLNWLLRRHNAALDIRRVLVLTISAFPDVPTGAEPAAGYRGWGMGILGPLSTMMKVRTSSQTARNDAELAALQAYWRGDGASPPDQTVDIQSFTLPFPRIDDFANERGEYDPPLSWKLSSAQKHALERAWQAPEVQTVADQISTLWRDWECPPSSPA